MAVDNEQYRLWVAYRWGLELEGGEGFRAVHRLLGSAVGCRRMDYEPVRGRRHLVRSEVHLSGLFERSDAGGPRVESSLAFLRQGYLENAAVRRVGVSVDQALPFERGEDAVHRLRGAVAARARSALDISASLASTELRRRGQPRADRAPCLAAAA